MAPVPFRPEARSQLMIIVLKYSCTTVAITTLPVQAFVVGIAFHCARLMFGIGYVFHGSSD